MTSGKSGLYYPNAMLRIYLTAIEEVIGPEAMAAMLTLANLPWLIGNYPPANMAREFDFADFGAIGAALEKMYGLRGERSLVFHAGKACYHQGVAQFGSLAGLGSLTSKAISRQARLKIGLKAFAEAFTKFSDQVTTVAESDRYFIYTIHRCPVCWGRSSSKPICYAATSIMQAGLEWLMNDPSITVEEVACHAMGDESCVFHN